MLGNTIDFPIKGVHENEATTLGKLKEAVRITQEVFDNLDDAAIQQLLGGSAHDLDKLTEIILDEVYSAVFGKSGLIQESSLQYLDKLTDNLEETLRVENLSYFVLSALPEFHMEWFHLEWAQYVMKYKKLAILASRNGGKSFFFSNAVPLWKMYKYKGKEDFFQKVNQDQIMCQRGFIVSNEMDLGIDLLEIIKGTIEENPILAKKLYPNVKESWNKQNIVCRNGARLSVKSYGGSFRGRHPGYIVGDDVLKDNVIYSESQRNKTTNYWHSVIMNAVMNGGQVILVGTPFHQLDLYGDLKTKKGWKVFEYPSIFPDGRLLTRRESFEELMEKKETQGNLIFSREKLVRPIVSDSSIFPFEVLQRAFIGMEHYTLIKNRDSVPKGIKFTKIVMGCDFAMSSAVGADYSVFTTWGITELEEMWLLHIYREKGKSYMEQITMLKMLYSNFKHDIIYAESNQFQMIFVEGMKDNNLPVFPHNTGTNKYDLKNGLPGLAIAFERNKIKLPRGDEYSVDMTDMVTSEFGSVAFTEKGLESTSQHDDIPMSTWQAYLAASHAVTGVGLGFLD